MRSRTGAVLLALLAACETIPETLTLDADGHGLEIKKQPALPDGPRDEPR